MTMNDEKSLLILNELRMAARDSEKGFQMAADLVPRPELVELLAELTLQRAKFARELEQRIRTLRSTPVDAPNPAAAVHRGWMAFKASAEANEAHAVLAECERGEGMAAKLWGTAVRDPDLDEQTRRLVQEQYELVQAAHDRIRQLRDSAEYAHR